MLLGTFDNSLIGRLVVSLNKHAVSGIEMSGLTFQQVSVIRLIAKLAVLWFGLLVLPFAERTLLGAKTYYFLYIGLGLVFVLYGLSIRSIFFFLQRARREPVYVWIGYLAWSVFICSILSVFAIEYDLLPQRQSHQLRMADL
jgi:hypothetical protein